LPASSDVGAPSPSEDTTGGNPSFEQLDPDQQARVIELVNTGMSLILAIIQAVRESQGGGGATIPVSHSFDTSSVPQIPPIAYAAGFALLAIFLLRR